MAFCALGMPDLPEGAPGVHGTVAGKPETRGRGGFTGVAADDYRYKVPQLYNLTDAGFLGHGGTFRSVREVVEYVLAGVPANPAVPPSQLAPEFRPIALPRGAVDDLVAFLEEALRDPDLSRYLPESLPSGSCFPNNDPQTREDLGFD
jgi:cytochrome c peroxidase